MIISIKCHDCKKRYTEDIEDRTFVNTDWAAVTMADYPYIMYCRYCYSDALFAEPVHMMDRHPKLKFAAELFVLFMMAVAVGALVVTCGARLGG